MAEAVGVTLPVEDGLSAGEYVGLAQLAERSGYDAVLAGEVAGPEVFSLLGMIAARTSSIRIGSGIVGGAVAGGGVCPGAASGRGGAAGRADPGRRARRRGRAAGHDHRPGGRPGPTATSARGGRFIIAGRNAV